jgi:non-canonical (house-cleaning) NTP pyrophosphatase
MKIVLASTSAVKLAACRAAFGDAAEIVTVKAASGVNEQPVGGETLTGAFNRISAAKAAIPGADLYVSIENGIFEEEGRYIDRPVVTVSTAKGAPQVTYGEGVEFPKDSVEEAGRRGFGIWTVGKVMQEQGLVRQHDDPHLDLSGKSRAVYLADAVKAAAGRLK